MLEGVELAGSSEAGLDFVADEEGARFVHGRFDLAPALATEFVDALALNRLDDEGGDVASS